MILNSKVQDLKHIELQRAFSKLPPSALVSMDSGILIVTRAQWRKPRIRRIYDRIGFVGLGPIPAHFNQIHSILAEQAHRIGDNQLGPEDVWCEDLADNASQILSTFFHNDSREEVHYVFAEVMLSEISLAERENDYLAYVTYDGRVIEASEERGVIVVSGLSWSKDEEEDEDDSPKGRNHSTLAALVLAAFKEIWKPDADPRVFIDEYRRIVPENLGILEIGWLDRGMVWYEKFDRVFNCSRLKLPEGLPTMVHRKADQG